MRPVSGLPVPGRTDFVEELELLAGGCAANTAAVLAKLGVHTRLAALIGQDTLGDVALAELGRAGVRLDTVWREAGVRTAAVMVVVSERGERSFLYRSGGNERLANRHVPDSALMAAGLVHVGGGLKLMSLDLAELMGRAKAFGSTTSLDTDWDPHANWMRRLQDALPKIDYLLTNQEEAAMLTGKEAPREAAQALLARGSPTVVVKRGQQGALLATRAGMTDWPAYRVEVRDTTCAGDAFVAGFLLSVSRGWGLAQAMRVGNAAGALCTTQISHRAITCLEQLLGLVKAQPVPAPAS